MAVNMDEVNVSDTLSHARRVLNSHREWLKKKNSTVSPVLDDTLLTVDDVEDDISTHPPPATSTPLRRPHSGKVAPQEQVFFKKGWEEERGEQIEGKENDGGIGKDARRKRTKSGRPSLGRGTVVPVTPLDSPTRKGSITNVFMGTTSTNAWDDNDNKINEHSLISKSDVIKSEIRLRETIAHIQADGEYDDSYDQDNDLQPFKNRLQSTSTPVMVQMQPTSDETSHSRHSQAKIDTITTVAQHRDDRTQNKIDIPLATTTINRRYSTGVTPTSSSSTIIVQPVKKKSLLHVQPIHVVQSIKHVLPIKVHRPVSQQSSYGDLILEDADDWIPPEDVIQSPYKSYHSITSNSHSDINVLDAVGVSQANYPTIRKPDMILEEPSERVPDDNGLQRYNTSTEIEAEVIPFSPKPFKRKGDVIQEDDEIDSIHENHNIQTTDSSVTLKQAYSNTTIGPTVIDLDTKDSYIEPVVTQQLPSSPLTKKPQPTDKLPPLVFEESTDGNREVPEKEGKKTKAKKNKKSRKKQEKEEIITTEIDESIDEKLSQEIVSVVNTTECVTNENGDTDNEREGDVSNDLPLLRVRSVTSLYTPEFKFQKKRERSPPDYHIHAQSSTLPPACPLYGTIQPTQKEVLNTSIVNRIVSPLKEMTTPSPIEIMGVFADRHDSISKDDTDSLYYSQRAITTPTSLGAEQTDRSFELHKAARAGHLRMMQALVMKGYKVDALDDDGRTPLMHCILPDGGAQVHCVDFLIRNGANLDHQSTEGITILHLASYQGIVSLMELLIINGANPDIKDIDGRLPLHWSTHPNTTKPIALLLKHSMSGVHVIDKSDMTLLMWACYNGNVTVAKYLLERGADPEEKDIEGKTAMHWSCSQCDINCLQLLLTPDMTYFKDHKGCTVIHTAAQSGFILGVQYILKKRSEAVHDTDKEGRTPLHYAAATDRVDICYLLLNKGADSTQKDKHGLTALEYGKKACHEYVVALFTCHTASMADFTRRERTLRNDSRQQTSRLHDIFEDNESDIVDESLQSHDYDNISIATTVTSSRFANDEECMKEAATGGYLGYFTCHDHKNITEKELKDPPCHYYFWIFSDKLWWSRSKDKRNKVSSEVTKLEEGPSLLVKSRPDHCPQDLHQFSFRVWLANQPIDLLAYSSDSYYMWIIGIKHIINRIEQASIYSDDVICNDDINSDTTKTQETEGLKKGLELM